MTNTASNISDPIRIREASTLDGEIVAQLIEELADAMGERVALTPEYVRVFLAYPGSHILLAEQNGAVAGLLSYTIRPNLYHAENCCMVDEVVVAGKARRRGIGKALVERLVQQAREAGCAEASLSVLPGNIPAQEFYKTLGFEDEALLMEMHFKRG